MLILIPLLFVAAPKPSLSDCSLALHVIGVGYEWRAGSSAKEYAAVRDDEACERILLEHDFGVQGARVRSSTGAERRIELRARPGLQLYVESAVARYDRPVVGPNRPSGLGWETSWVQGRASYYRPVCEGTCTGTVSEGAHHFALGFAGKPLAEVHEEVLLDRSSVLEADLVSYSTERLVGASIIVGGTATVLAAVVWALATIKPEGGLNVGPLATGLSGLGLIGLGATLTFGIYFEDEVRFEVRPPS